MLEHDSDFALAVQLQEEENLRSAQFEANQQSSISVSNLNFDFFV